jgi:hypothetical protein
MLLALNIKIVNTKLCKAWFLGSMHCCLDKVPQITVMCSRCCHILFHDATNMKEVCDLLPKCVGVKLRNEQQVYFRIRVQFLKMQILCISNVEIRKCIRIFAAVLSSSPETKRQTPHAWHYRQRHCHLDGYYCYCLRKNCVPLRNLSRNVCLCCESRDHVYFSSHSQF